MSKPYRSLAVIGELDLFHPWLFELLDDEERGAELCAQIRAEGLARLFLGSEAGPVELLLCDGRKALHGMLQADGTVHLGSPPLSFAFAAAALGAPVCLPDDDEPLPLGDLFEDEVAEGDPAAPLRARIDRRERTPDGVVLHLALLEGTVALGDVVALPGVGSWTVSALSAEGTPLASASAGELVELVLADFTEPEELVGSLLTADPAPEAVRQLPLDAEDGGGRLWWRDGWVRVAVKDGVATLRAPRLLASGTRVVLARGDAWSVRTIG